MFYVQEKTFFTIKNQKNIKILENTMNVIQNV